MPVALGIVTLTFLVVRLAPGDPALLLAGPDAPPEVVENLRVQLGLDKPLPHQYIAYLRQLMRGDLGFSVRNNEPVASFVGRTLPHTLELVLVAEVISSLVGIPLGVVSALRRGAWLDKVAMSAAVMGVSVPIFFTGLVLMLIFGYYLQWLPLGDRGGPLWTVQGWRHVILPGLTLASFHVASLARVTRSSMLEVLNQDYVRTARAKGLKEVVVVYVHALRNALLPVLTVMGLNLAQFIGGTVVTETIYSWPGMGREVVRAVLTRDYAVLQGFLLAIGFMIIAINIIIDILYVLVDPRVRYA